MSDEKYNPQDVKISINGELLTSISNVTITNDADASMPSLGIYDSSVPQLDVPQLDPQPFVTPVYAENLDIDPAQLEQYVKDYFEKCFKKEGVEAQMPKMPEKVAKQMKIPGIKDISGSRKLKIQGE